ncbi:hypothetical protein ABT297_09175 [Dactylosporangium sp. NPDC000555]|uniref:PaaI family thioesterase n=1 Tax=Dactylosporangium sp. NPDC000555 TaxID=3154260 RepID=UPI00331F5507
MNATPPAGPANLAELVHATRELMVAVGLTDVDEADVRAATDAVTRVTATLRERSRPRLIRRLETSPNGDGGMHPTHEAVSGSLNPLSGPIMMIPDAEGGLTATARVSPLVEGPPDAVHGGYVAMVVDSLMGQLIRTTGVRAVTGTLLLRYRHRTPLEEELTFAARITERVGRRIKVYATVSAGGVVTVESEATFVEVAA